MDTGFRDGVRATGRQPDRGASATAALAYLRPAKVRREIAGYLIAVAGSAALTAVFLPFRRDITPLSKGFGFLVVVVIAAWVGGLGPGIAASIVGFLVFNFFFIPPYGTFTIASPEHVVVLFVFLGLSVLISALLARARGRAEAAEARATELRILQELSGDLVARVPGPEAYEVVLTRLVREFGFASASLQVRETRRFQGLAETVAVGTEPGTLTENWDPRSGGRSPDRLPLSVGSRNLGLLVLQGDRPPLGPSESRVLRAFCDQLALVLERDRLLLAATDAEVYRQADDVRRSLFAAVSHDLRSPLAAIKASATDLMDTATRHPEADVREALAAIDGEADRMDALITGLLDMSRIEAGMLKARDQDVDLAEIISAAVDRARPRWPGVTVQVRVEPAAAVVRADPVFLDRVITNLLDNACRAATVGDEPSIEIEARRRDDRSIVRVVDHGAGVPETVQEQLFHPFYRLDKRDPRLGRGLGLAISKGFVSLMRGEIWVEDTPGGGATFAFSLPAAAPHR